MTGLTTAGHQPAGEPAASQSDHGRPSPKSYYIRNSGKMSNKIFHNIVLVDAQHSGLPAAASWLGRLLSKLSSTAYWSRFDHNFSIHFAINTRPHRAFMSLLVKYIYESCLTLACLKHIDNGRLKVESNIGRNRL